MINIKSVYKKFKVAHTSSRTMIGKLENSLRFKRQDNFYALKNITLKISEGETIGIIGSNGSGKSTLLKIISKILVPTSGTVSCKGNIIPLIELGSGLQEDLTARQNIFLYGALMGLNKKDIKNRFNDIVKFSGIQKFLDTELQNFSSGMRARLAFSIAVQTNPDILILDEIFSVGDKEFQEKSVKVLQNLKKKGIIILLASHNMKHIEKFCNKTILLNKGELVMFDKTSKVIRHYNNIRLKK